MSLKAAEKYKAIIERRLGKLPNCPFCNSQMLFRAASTRKIQKAQIQISDIILKCPKCFYVATFGVPITPQEYEEVKNLLGIDLLQAYVKQDLEQEDLKKLIEHLKRLGYID